MASEMQSPKGTLPGCRLAKATLLNRAMRCLREDRGRPGERVSDRGRLRVHVRLLAVTG